MMLTYKYRVKDATSGKYLNRHARGELWMELLLRDPARSAAALEGGNAVLLADRVRPDQVVHGDRRRSWTALRYGSDGLPAVHCVARCQARMPSVPGQFRSAPQTWMDCVYPTCLEGGWLDGRLPQTQVLLLDVAGD